jgi:hypothetical protein
MQIVNCMETPIKYPQSWNHFIFQAPSPIPGPYSNPGQFCALVLGLPLSRPCAGLKTFFTQHLHTVANKTTRVFCNIFHLLARDSALTQSSNLTLYKLLTRSILTYAAPVWSSKVTQSKCVRVIGNHPRPTPTAHLHYTLNMEPIICSLPFTPQPPGPTDRELYSSRLDKHAHEI